MRFSIITICFNSEKTIERTIKSVLAQTYKDFEYIIVDGGSIDKTLDILKKYEPLFEGRLKWKSEPDNGIYNAMNKGVSRATGQIIGIVNSDDWLELDALEIVSDTINNEKLDYSKPLLVTGWICYHYVDGSKHVMKTNRDRYEYYAKRLRMGLNHPATFVSKATYNQIGLFDENYKLFADADFIVRCYRADVKAFFVDKILSNMSDGGASSRVTKKAYRDSLYRIDKYYPDNNINKRLKQAQVGLHYIGSYLIPYFIVKLFRKKKNK